MLTQKKYFANTLKASRYAVLLGFGACFLAMQPAKADDAYGWRWSLTPRYATLSPTASVTDANGVTHSASVIQYPAMTTGHAFGGSGGFASFTYMSTIPPDPFADPDPVDFDVTGVGGVSMQATALVNTQLSEGNLTTLVNAGVGNLDINLELVGNYIDFTDPSRGAGIPTTGTTTTGVTISNGFADALASYTKNDGIWTANVGKAASSLSMDNIPGDEALDLPEYLEAASPAPKSFGSATVFDYLSEPVFYYPPDFIYGTYNFSSIYDRFRGGGGIIKNGSLVWGFNIDIVSGMDVDIASIPQDYYQAAPSGTTYGSGISGAWFNIDGLNASARNGSTALADAFAVIYAKGESL